MVDMDNFLTILLHYGRRLLQDRFAPQAPPGTLGHPEPERQ